MGTARAKPVLPKTPGGLEGLGRGIESVGWNERHYRVSCKSNSHACRLPFRLGTVYDLKAKGLGFATGQLVTLHDLALTLVRLPTQHTLVHVLYYLRASDRQGAVQH
jgi:hypothetical protein